MLKDFKTPSLIYNAKLGVLVARGTFRFIDVTRKATYQGKETNYRAEVHFPITKEDKNALINLEYGLLHAKIGGKAQDQVKRIFGVKSQNFVYDQRRDEVDFSGMSEEEIEKQKQYRSVLKDRLLVKASCNEPPLLYLDEKESGGGVYELKADQYKNLVGIGDGFGSEGQMYMIPYCKDGKFVYAVLKKIVITKPYKGVDDQLIDFESGEEIVAVPYDEKKAKTGLSAAKPTALDPDIDLDNLGDLTDFDDEIPF